MLLKAEGIIKKYGKENAVIYAVKDITLEFDEGRFYAFLGRSGSGKSTLLHILGGLLPPDEGTVSYKGKDLYLLGDQELAAIRRNEISMIFQDFHLLPDLSAEANILLPAKLNGGSADPGYLDEQSSQDVLHLLKKIHEIYHTTILLVTHDRMVASQADEQIHIADGRIVKG